MRFRTCLLPLLAWLASSALSHAQIEIEKATWGLGKKDVRDVREIVRAYVRHNRLSFRVTPESMGGDLNPRKRDLLTIKYRVDGRRYEDEVEEGDTFTFQGLSGVAASRPYLGFIPQLAPSAAPVRIVNQTPATMLIYALDRYGRWLWQGELQSGRVFTDTAAVGQQWRITNRANETVESFTVRSSGSTITLGQPTGPTRVRFDNSDRQLLFVYKLDRWRNWEWVARLDPGASLSVNGISGENWIVIDQAGRTVRQFAVGPSTCHQRF